MFTQSLQFFYSKVLALQLLTAKNDKYVITFDVIN